MDDHIASPRQSSPPGGEHHPASGAEATVREAALVGFPQEAKQRDFSAISFLLADAQVITYEDFHVRYQHSSLTSHQYHCE